MAARAHSADPRAERVRTRLRDAAFELAHERPVDQLSAMIRGLLIADLRSAVVRP